MKNKSQIFARNVYSAMIISVCSTMFDNKYVRHTSHVGAKCKRRCKGAVRSHSILAVDLHIQRRDIHIHYIWVRTKRWYIVGPQITQQISLLLIDNNASPQCHPTVSLPLLHILFDQAHNIVKHRDLRRQQCGTYRGSDNAGNPEYGSWITGFLCKSQSVWYRRNCRQIECYTRRHCRWNRQPLHFIGQPPDL